MQKTIMATKQDCQTTEEHVSNFEAVENLCYKFDADPSVRKLWTDETLQFIDNIFDNINKAVSDDAPQLVLKRRAETGDDKISVHWSDPREESTDIRDVLQEITDNIENVGK